MLDHIRCKIVARVRRFVPARVARHYARQQDGAVEFALVALPFLALTFAILETALVFFAGQTLEAAATNAGRLIMTGQAQNGAYSQTDFKQKVCDALAGGLVDCTNSVYVDVKIYTNYAGLNNASPIVNGQFDTSKVSYSRGSQGSIVVVTLYYQWPIYVSLLGNNLAI